MNTKKYYLIFMLVFLFLLLGTTISYGAYNASSSTVQSGEKVTVKVTSSEALEAYNLDLQSHEGLTFNSCSKSESGAIININGSSIGYMNMAGSTKDLGTYTFTAPNVTEDKKYTITFMVDKKTSVTSTITVKAPVVETPPPSTTTPETEKPSTDTNSGTNDSTNTKPEEVTKSSEARLKNLGINPKEYDFSGFKKDKTEYSVSVPNNVESVEVYAEPVDSKAKVSGDGKVTLNEGNNKIGIKVTAEDGKTTKTYTLTIKRKTVEEEEKENGENRLKSLSIKPKEYDFSGFNSEATEYTAEVPNEVDQIEILATAKDSNAQITGIGMIDLEEGENELKIEVIAVNGDKKTYTLTVTRKEAEVKEIFGLTSLLINGIKLTPSFKAGIYEYTAELQEDLNSLQITAKANHEDATVEIVGNENLQAGENVITIMVENTETEEVATYQITINKNVVVAEVVEKTSWLKPSTWGKEEIIKLIIIVVLIILIICAIILKINISKESTNDIKVDFPGAEELDKAITEHQELVQEENFMQGIIGEKNIYVNSDEKNYIEEIAKDRFDSDDYSIEEKPKRKGRHF